MFQGYVWQFVALPLQRSHHSQLKVDWSSRNFGAVFGSLKFCLSLNHSEVSTAFRAFSFKVSSQMLFWQPCQFMD
jgi:hypothetical protein